jgi:leucyl aminopeptidase
LKFSLEEMKPEIIKINRILPDHSVVCILGKNAIPESLGLSKTEKTHVLKRLKEEEETVYINSYFRSIYFVRIRDGANEFRVRETLRRSASALKKLIRSNDHAELVITSSDAYKGAIGDFTEGLVLSIYTFDKYRTKEDDKNKKGYPPKLLLFGDIDKAGIKWLTILTDAVYFVRDMINEPVNYLNTITLAKEVKRIGKLAGLRVEILEKGQIEALKMGGLLAVNKGSVDPPVFCILEWKPAKCLNKRPFVLVGKGIVYDTGGLNIKTGDYMNNMKGDMAGAAAVIGTLYTLARNGIPLHVIGLVPATDNRPGGNAYTQGDIITMYNKTTVEVTNTDAEGRLILADAISYASKYDPELIIDIATLTGSAAATFGNQAIAMMSNADRKYLSLLEECGNLVHERIAELPSWEEYSEMIKSDIADIKNSGGREAGAITAGKFLMTFTKFPLVHLDIAGTATIRKDDFYRLKDGTGSGVRLLATFFKRLATVYKKL